MIDFIVVEDNANHSKRTKRIIFNYMMKNKLDFDILIFSEVSSDLNDMIENHDAHHIYVLDFELGGATAIDVARKIRKHDWVSPIIVYTVNGGMAMETFKQRLQILDFVSKQFEGEKNLCELFDICLKQIEVRDNFKYRIGKVDYSIDFNKILYIYKDTIERKSVIVTDNSEYKIPMNLVRVKELLPSEFVFTHKACIVNTSRVDAYVWSENKIIFDSGVVAPFLSKTHKKELAENGII